MHRVMSVKITDLNNFLKCLLCKGYFVDSFTINECLHSFCKSCIIKYIRRKECCPTCKIPIMKEKLSSFIRRDVNLQCIVFKLVPGLFKSEMKRRRLFYSSHPKALKYLKKMNLFDKEAIGELDEDVFLIDNQTEISLSIEYSETGLPDIFDSARTKELEPNTPKTYLQCPSVITIQLLKKFLIIKFDIKSTKQIDILYDDKPLKNELTLQDVAYIYAWRRTAPMRLFYRYNGNTINSHSVQLQSTNVLAPIDANKIIQQQDEKEIAHEQEKKSSLPNSKLKLDDSICENIPPAIVKTKEDYKQEELEQNNPNVKENLDASVSKISSELTKHDSKNESIIKEHNPINSQSTMMINSLENNLTITAMVASIAQDKNYLSSTPEAITNSLKENEQQPEEVNETKFSTTTATTTTSTTSDNSTNQLEKNQLKNNAHTQVPNLNSNFNSNSTTNHSLSEINTALVINKSNEDTFQPLNLQVKKPKFIKPKKIIERNEVEKNTLCETNATENTNKPKKLNANKQSTTSNLNKKMRPSQSKKQLSKTKTNQQDESKTPTNKFNSNQPLNLSQYRACVTPNNKNSDHFSTTNTQPIITTNFEHMPMSLMNNLINNKQWNHHYDNDNQGGNFYNFHSPRHGNSTLNNSQHNTLTQLGTSNCNSGINTGNNGFDFKTQIQALANPFPNPQKYASSLLDAYLQSKAQPYHKQQQAQNLLHSNANNANQHFFNANLHYNQSNHQNQLCYNPSQINMEQFIRPLSTFASLIQEAASYPSNLLHASKNYNQTDKLSNCTAEPLSFTSASSFSTGFDSLKETQLKISESCSLVNEST